MMLGGSHSAWDSNFPSSITFCITNTPPPRQTFATLLVTAVDRHTPLLARSSLRHAFTGGLIQEAAQNQESRLYPEYCQEVLILPSNESSAPLSPEEREQCLNRKANEPTNKVIREKRKETRDHAHSHTEASVRKEECERIGVKDRRREAP